VIRQLEAISSKRSGRRVLFHRHFGLEAFDITKNRGDGKRASIAVEAQKAIVACDVAFERFGSSKVDD
jgi:hypothetical protein